ncbi:hepatitis A virus cellular receptor 1 homolog [Pristis pectinata]|uniref:hepatitis A virus cellular receptor 1 homolog n=1 Tax=Pristis pectinata TaxID=685728 RepID=UPI00223D0A1E|nr:hepatitis A virus cellular receptor 1 homolog [Pristis pectinata]
MAVTGGVAHWTVMSLLLGRVSLVAGSEVRGVPGQSITLPCNYSVGKSGESEMCWGRGHCTVMGCGGELIRTNGHTVTSTTSPRYHLGGRIEEGDVSLTINHLEREDSGSYCCRVEIDGWFNDQKVIMNLQVLDEPSTASPSTTAEFFSTGYGNNVAPLTSQETWLSNNIPDTAIQLDGLTSIPSEQGSISVRYSRNSELSSHYQWDDHFFWSTRKHGTSALSWHWLTVSYLCDWNNYNHLLEEIEEFYKKVQFKQC